MEKFFFSSNEPIIIAEIGQAHDGSLGIASSYIELSKQCKVDYVKFQTHLADYESSNLEPWRIKFSAQDEKRIDYWRRMEFSFKQWKHLKEKAKNIGIGFVSSPFSVEAVDLLEKLHVPFYKIASGEIDNIPMLSRIKETKKPVVISTGLSETDELDRLVEFFDGHDICILHCVSEYPTLPENANLKRIPFLKNRYKNCAIGISDHSGTIYPSLFALQYGISVIELHLTFNKKIFGPDTSSSLSEKELKLVKEGIRFYKAATEAPKTDRNHKNNMKKTFGRSAFLRRSLLSGDKLDISNIIMRKPAIGLSYAEINEYIGKTLNQDLSTEMPILGSYFEKK